MRHSVAVLCCVGLMVLSAHAQKTARVYDHTGILQVSVAQPDVDVNVDGHRLVCFGDVCNTSGLTAGAAAILDPAVMITYEGHSYLSEQGILSADAKDEPLLRLMKDHDAGHPSPNKPNSTDWTFQYRLDTKKYWGGSGYKPGPVFCIPVQDKNGKQTKREACYPLR